MQKKTTTKKQSLLFYLKYIFVYKLIHSPTPGFTEKKIVTTV